jgi:hypothetical protein
LLGCGCAGCGKTSMTTKKVLIICPVFFNYEKRIKQALENQGYNVTMWGDRASTHFIYKVCLRLFPYSTSFLSEYFFSKKLQELKDNIYDNVIVIKGEALSVKFLKNLLATILYKRSYYYLWDSIKNTNYAVEKAQLFEHVGTFDPFDAKAQNWGYRPLFASNSGFAASELQGNQWDLCFAGTVHSDRLQVIQKIKNKLPCDLNFYCFAHVPSELILRLKKYAFSVYRNFDKTQLTTKSLPYDEVLEKFNHSKAIIDIEHPGQRGLTMRSIEVLLANKKLITTNRSIISSDLYHADSVLVIDRENPIIDIEFLNSPTPVLNCETASKYTIECFVNDLCGGSTVR